MSLSAQVKCDYCAQVQELVDVSAGGRPNYVHDAVYPFPASWLAIDGRHFCGWPCVGRFALERAPVASEIAAPEPAADAEAAAELLAEEAA